MNAMSPPESPAFPSAERGGFVTAIREFATALSNWRRTIAFLMLQYVGAKSIAGPFSVFLVMVEPVIYIVTLYVIRVVFRGMVQGYGTSMLLWLSSGIFAYFFFVNSSNLSRSMRAVQPLPRIRPMDVLIAQVTANALIWLVTIVGFMFGMWIYGIDQARPDSLTTCIEALFFLLILGIGVGLVNSSICRFFPFWMMIYRIFTSGMLFFAGVIKIPDMYDLWLRNILVWNPILQGVALFHLGVYGNIFPHTVLDTGYLVKCAVIALFVGLIADRATLRYAGR